MRTSATPVTVCSRGLTMRLTRSLICSGVSVSLVKASQITGNASASTFAITGSSMACGSLLRTREVRSRTSAAAASASFSSRNRTWIWVCSGRLMEVMTSTASMPAIESSRGLVTWDSITSEEAPAYRTLTVTMGSSIFGYSRTARRVKLTAPTSSTSSDSTVANTGRRMAISGSCIAMLPSLFRRALRPRTANGAVGAGDVAGIRARRLATRGRSLARRFGGAGRLHGDRAARRRRAGHRRIGRGWRRARARGLGGGATADVDHPHRHAVALDALLPGRDHQVAGLQALGDLHLARTAQADLDLDPLRRARVLVGTIDEAVDELPVALRHDG